MTRLLPAQGYELWAPSYDSDPNPVLALELRTLTKLLEEREPGQMLDVACGTGRWMLRYRRLGTSVTGLDISQHMLTGAAKHQVLRGRLVQADACRLPIAHGFADLILCSMALGYFRDLREVFSEFARAARKGARVVISDLHPDAVAAGWRRSFSIGASRFEIEHHAHSLGAMECAALQAGLHKTHGEAAYFGEPELAVFRAAGKEAAFHKLRETPVLFAAVWEKRC